MKLLRKGIRLDDAEAVRPKEDLSASRVSTVHGVESKGYIPLGVSCMSNFRKENVGLSSWGSLAVYVRLESQAKEAELDFDDGNYDKLG